MSSAPAQSQYSAPYRDPHRDSRNDPRDAVSGEPTTWMQPPRPLGAGRTDALTRTMLLLLAVAMVVTSIGTLVWVAALTAVDRSDFGPLPSMTMLGRPTAITLHSGTAHVAVIPDPDATEAQLRLVDAHGALAERAQGTIVSTARGAGAVEVTVTQPGVGLTTPWSSGSADLELVLPTEVAASAPLTIQADTGDVRVAPGQFAALDVSADIGAIDLASVSTTGAVTATASEGDVHVAVAPGAQPPAAIDAVSETGEVTVSVPGDALYAVEATADVGATDVEAGITGTGPRLRARTDVGDVTVSR